MTAEQLLRADLPAAAATPTTPAPLPDASAVVATIRASFALVEPQAAALGRHFCATLFRIAPQTRDLFPVNMEVQGSRLLRALVHVVQMIDQLDDLVPFLQQLGRDNRKFGVITDYYASLGTALLSTIETYAGDAWTPAVAKAWTDAYGLASKVMSDAAAADHGRASWMGRIVDHRRLGWDIAVITVQTDEPVPYQAGQYVSVETPQRPRLWRYLSPANAPRPDSTLEFHVRAVTDGWVSPAIVAHARVGDTWRIGPPIGRMGLDKGHSRDLLMVAGGTGMAPMKAILDDIARRPAPPRAQLFVGGRTWEDLYDYDALRKLSYAHPWLDVVPVLERDDNASGAERGTLADVVSRYGAWSDHDVLVCGSPAMIRATVSRMLVAGTSLERIRYDPFTTY